MERDFRIRIKYAMSMFLMLCALFILNNIIFGRILGGFLGSYVFPALLWVLIAFYVVRLPAYRPAAKLRFRRLLCWLGFISALGAVLITYAVGFAVGLGKSPYDHSLMGVITNILCLSSMLAGVELSRSWLLRALFRERPALGVAVISFIYSFFWFSLGKINFFQEKLEILKFVGGTYFPALSENMLASYLSILGGPLPALVYHGTLIAFEWFVPILPNLNWAIQSIIGILLPISCLLLVHQLYSAEARQSKTERLDNKELAGWIFTSVISVLILWFSLGLFSIFPNAILTGSMSPLIMPGDVVLVNKAAVDTIKEGDIIQFREDEFRINHRVIKVAKDETGREFFVTKGDANQSPDVDPVYPEQVVGRVIYVVPKLGWLTIMVRTAN